VKARELATYTIRITNNKKIFDIEYQEALTNKIIGAALEIYVLAFSANEIRANSREGIEERLRIQRMARNKCNELISLINIAHQIFHLRARRVKYWSGLANETKRLIAAWASSDMNRLKAMT
jgi:hypothetical protein